jgi:predicted permease
VSPSRLSVTDVTHDWFSVLGVRMALGRGFTAAEEGLGAPKVAVLGNALWRQQFGGDPAIVGRTIHLDGSPYTVVGVAPIQMTFPEHTVLWRPIALTAETLANRGSRVFWGPIGRLRRGVSFAAAEREVRVVAARLHARFPQSETGLDYDIVPFRDHLVGTSRIALVVLLAAVSCLLLLACVSIATLLLARATSRRAEIGLRLALGAGPGRIVRQLLVESVLLAVVGGMLGVMIAVVAVRLVVAYGSGTIPLLENVSVDVRVLAVTGLVTVGAGMLFGLAPALEAARTDVAASLMAGARGSSGRAGSARGRSALVSGELALAVPLLVAAVLLGKSFVRLLAVDPGFRSAEVIRFDLTLPACGTGWAPDSTCAGVQGTHYTSPTAIRNFTDRLLTALRAEPDTRAVGAAFGVPFSEWARNQTAVNIDGRPPAPVDRPNVAESKYATPGYFAALGIPVVRGRAFTEADRANAPPVAIVSEGFARAYLPGEDPIGKRIVGVGDIIGVVGDTKTQGLDTTPEPAIYQSLEQAPIPYITVVIRTGAEPGAAMRQVRAQVAALDPALPVSHLMTMDDAVRASAAERRLDAWVVSGFAAMALLLATLGIYGVIAFSVRERQRELGVRLALGARASDIMALVLARGIRVALVGLVAGCGLAFAAGSALRGLLFGVQPLDAGTYALVCGTLLTMAVVASWIPARRAARVDAAVSLRSE